MLLLRRLRPVHSPFSCWHAAAAHARGASQAQALVNQPRSAIAHRATAFARPAPCRSLRHCGTAASSTSAQQVAEVASPPVELPTSAVGQVMASEANYVRVDVHGPEGADGSEPNRRLPRRQLLCTVRALLKKVRQSVLVGDHVRVGAIDWVEGRAQVEEVLPRSSVLTDPSVANVDHVLLLFGLTQPPFEEQQVTRFLVSIEASGLPLTLALNKADLVGPEEVAMRVEQCASWGYTALPVSCESGEGIGALAEALAGRTSVVAGPSGAGKSSLINALRLGQHRPEGPVLPVLGAGRHEEGAGQSAFGSGEEHDDAAAERRASGSGASSSGSWDEGADYDDEYTQDGRWQAVGDTPAGGSASTMYGGSSRSDRGRRDPSGFLAVGELSKVGRGKHTTTTVSLIPLPGGGAVADTPGFSQPTLEGVSSQELAHCFPEMRRAMEQGQGCRFADCLHLAEPGCVVSSADLERYEWYVKFLAEIQAREDYDVRMLQLAKKQREGAVKRMTGRGGAVRQQVRLDTKSQRALSRRRARQSIMVDELDGESPDAGNQWQ